MLPLIVRPALVDLIGGPTDSARFNAWVAALFYVPAVAGGVFGMPRRLSDGSTRPAARPDVDAANIGARTLGTGGALVTALLVPVMPLATAADLVGIASFVAAFAASGWLPEPKSAELPA